MTLFKYRFWGNGKWDVMFIPWSFGLGFEWRRDWDFIIKIGWVTIVRTFLEQEEGWADEDMWDE